MEYQIDFVGFGQYRLEGGVYSPEDQAWRYHAVLRVVPQYLGQPISPGAKALAVLHGWSDFHVTDLILSAGPNGEEPSIGTLGRAALQWVAATMKQIRDEWEGAALSSDKVPAP